MVKIVIYQDFIEDYLDPKYSREALIMKYDLRIGEYKRLVRRVVDETGYDKRGKHSKNSKLWNVSYAYYNAKNQLPHKPSKSFYAKYKGKLLKIGGFKEPVSCEIIGELISKWGKQ